MNIIKNWVRDAWWRPGAGAAGAALPSAFQSRTSMPPPRAIRDIGRSGTLAVNAGCGGLSGPGARDAPGVPRVGAAPPERRRRRHTRRTSRHRVGHGRGPSRVAGVERVGLKRDSLLYFFFSAARAHTDSRARRVVLSRVFCRPCGPAAVARVGLIPLPGMRLRVRGRSCCAEGRQWG